MRSDWRLLAFVLPLLAATACCPPAPFAPHMAQADATGSPPATPCTAATVAVCDDGNVCTTDSCDPDYLHCNHVANDSACDDGDPCTVADHCASSSCQSLFCPDDDVCTTDTCAAGKCQHQIVVCDDGDPCTVDDCKLTAPFCTHVANCDDGIACTTDACDLAAGCTHTDACDGGKVCDKASGLCKAPCALPTAWSQNVQVISKLEFLENGQGCDLNGDGKPDNKMGNLISLYKDLNTAFKGAIQDGSRLTVLHAPQFTTSGAPFVIEEFDADLDPSQPACDVTAGGPPCKLRIKAASYERDSAKAICAAKHRLDPATAAAGALKATSTAAAVWFLGVGQFLDMQAASSTWTGNVLGASQWQATTSGMVCGVIRKDAFKTALEAIPLDEVAVWMDDSPTVRSLIAGIIKPDLDLDGDGVKESISFAMTFETAPVLITGVSN